MSVCEAEGKWNGFGDVQVMSRIIARCRALVVFMLVGCRDGIVKRHGSRLALDRPSSFAALMEW